MTTTSNTMRRVRIWMLLTLLTATQQVLATGIEARLDRQRVAEGETVVLRLNVPGDLNGTPDLSPLVQDFDLLDSSQSMQMSIVNGRSSSSRGWQFVLAPKRTGKLSIPPLPVGSASTRELAVEVVPAAQAAQAGPAAPVLLEIDAEPRQPLVQQKVIYRVRLLSRVPLRQTRISEPRIGDAIVEPLGRETEYSTQRDGQQYRVIERRYAVFPQRSGTLQIDGPVLSAEVPEPGQRGSGRQPLFPGPDPFADLDRLFGRGNPLGGSLFGRTRRIQLRGRHLMLDVQAQPAGAASPWLPAESLTLSDAWSQDPPQFRVGEPITRSVAITAQGLSATQLPPLELEAPEGISVYPDKPQVSARVDGDTLVAQKVIRAALVPARSGRVTLPAVRLAWWDLASGQQKVASLPAREVDILPAPAGAADEGGDAAQGAVRVAPAMPQTPAGSEPRAASVDGSPADAAAAATGSDYWPWVVFLLGLAWVATLGLWWRARRSGEQRSTHRAAAPPVPDVDPGHALRRVEQACRANDARAARHALLAWGQSRWPEDPPRTLDSLAQRLGDGAASPLQQIDRQLYADAADAWDGGAAWGQLSGLPTLRGRPTDRGQRAALPPLYPQGT